MTDRYRIFVGADLEEPGRVALREALQLAAGHKGAELHVAHVLAPTNDLESMSATLDRTRPALQREVEDVAKQMGIVADVHLHVRFGGIVETLQQIAVDYDADLLVVGTRALRGIERIVLGSLAAELVASARLPVLVARPKDFQGLARSPFVEPAEPGLELHRDQVVSEAVQIGRRDSHISGLV